MKHSLYGRRDAPLQLHGDVVWNGRRDMPDSGDNISRLLAAAGAELDLLNKSPDSKKRTRNSNGEPVAVNLMRVWDSPRPRPV